MLAIVAASLFFGLSASAQTTGSRLDQTIKPIECVYTNTETGGGNEISSMCSDQSAPTLTKITILARKQPILSGKFSALNTKTLRIWIGGVWYTKGVSPYLRTDGDNWYLDLSASPLTLPPGSYTVIAEVLTNDSFLLSSAYTDALSISAVVETPTSPDHPPTGTGNGQAIYNFQLRGDGTYILTPDLIGDDPLAPIVPVTDGPARPQIDYAVSPEENSQNQLERWLPPVIAGGLAGGGLIWRYLVRRRLK